MLLRRVHGPYSPYALTQALLVVLEGPVEVRFSRIEVPRLREARPTCPQPLCVHDSHLRVLDHIQATLQRNEHAERGPGSVGPDTCRAARDSGPPSSGPSRTTKRLAECPKLARMALLPHLPRQRVLALRVHDCPPAPADQALSIDGHRQRSGVRNGNLDIDGHDRVDSR